MINNIEKPPIINNEPNTDDKNIIILNKYELKFILILFNKLPKNNTIIKYKVIKIFNVIFNFIYNTNKDINIVNINKDIIDIIIVIL